MYSARDRQGLPDGVAPFGDPRLCLLPANRGLSQVTTSFIASRCQGIHRTPLLAWPKNYHHHSTSGSDLSINQRISSNTPSLRPTRRCSRLPLHSTVKDLSQPPPWRLQNFSPSREARRRLHRYGGDERDRTVDLRLAKPALSQLSYIPAHSAPCGAWRRL